jgi:CDP-4-dehydro-6-deoxyglucose reductase, E1
MKKNKFQHKLMSSNFSKDDFKKLENFFKTANEKTILTQGPKVEIFEKEWSKWLGVKYSTFVNSGSSANLLSISILKIIEPKKKEIIVPSHTWVSDIASIIQNNFKPIFVDMDIKNLGPDNNEIISKINSNTAAIFLSHIQGFNALSEKLLKIIKQKKILLIEDVCESHGAKFKNKKLGSLGLISNFSFYYAHHMSTIEGGMICTNDRKIYELSRLLRSHSMVREIKDTKLRKEYEKKYKDLSPKFIFLYPGYNVRNNEIGAILGLNQLKNLDSNNEKRTKNLIFFLNNLDREKFITNFDTNGSSNYALPLILKKKSLKLRDDLEKLMKRNNIEFRRGGAGGGNQLRQPYLKNYIKGLDKKKFKNVEHMHFYGYYIGNFPSLKALKIKKICNILNSL